MRFLVIAAAISIGGCNYISTEDVYLQACGPIAISNAVTKAKRPTTTKAVSDGIRDHAIVENCLRGIFSIFYEDAALITWPWEMKNELERRGFIVKEKRGSKEEMLKYFNEEIMTNLEVVAIILLKDSSRIKYHWTAFPSHRNIPTFFGKYTVICSIYVLEVR